MFVKKASKILFFYICNRKWLLCSTASHDSSKVEQLIPKLFCEMMDCRLPEVPEIRAVTVRFQSWVAERAHQRRKLHPPEDVWTPQTTWLSV